MIVRQNGKEYHTMQRREKAAVASQRNCSNEMKYEQ